MSGDETIVITPTWIEVFQELHSTTTAPELWDVLVSWHGIRSSSVWEEPFILYTRFHRDDARDAIVTAALPRCCAPITAGARPVTT